MGKSSRFLIPGFFALALSLLIGPPAQAKGNPFAGQTAEHDTLLNAIANLQASVDALGQVAPPCGADTAGERFIVLDGDSEVCDNTTGIVWQKEPSNESLMWVHAVNFCSSLGGGYRLPVVKELITVVDYAEFNPTLPTDTPFVNVQPNYWSATFFAVGASNAWFVDFVNGIVNFGSESNVNHTWCVRELP